MIKNFLPKIPIEKITWEGIDIPLALGLPWFDRWRSEEPGLEISLDDTALGGNVRVEKHDDNILVRGQIIGELLFACSRCLDSFKGPLECRFDLLLRLGRPPEGGEEVELTAEELDLDYYTEDELNVEKIVREQILLALPLKPLCREDCAGLCSYCGTNLNREKCSCKRGTFNQPFAVLDKLKKIM
jgi:uncharacterized protein